MKKNKILKTIAIFSTCMCAPLVLSGCEREVESKVSFRVEDGYIQVTEDGTNWKNLIDVDDLKGEPGQQGVAGKQVEFQATETHIQWRYVGDVNWIDLVTFEDLEQKEDEVDVEALNQRGFTLFKSKLNDMKSKSSYKLTYDYRNRQEIEYYASLGVVDSSLIDKGEDGIYATNVFGFALYCIQTDDVATLENGELYNPYKLRIYGKQNMDWVSTHFIELNCNKNAINNEFEIVDGAINDSFSSINYSESAEHAYNFVDWLENFELDQVKDCQFNANGDCKITFTYNKNVSTDIFNKNFIYEFCVNSDGYIEKCNVYEKDFLNENEKSNLYCQISYLERETDITLDMFNAVLNYVKVDEYVNADLATIFGYEIYNENA